MEYFRYESKELRCEQVPLRELAERAAELGGSLRVRRRNGGGLRITVTAPAANRPAGTEPAVP